MALAGPSQAQFRAPGPQPGLRPTSTALFFGLLVLWLPRWPRPCGPTVFIVSSPKSNPLAPTATIPPRVAEATIQAVRPYLNTRSLFQLVQERPNPAQLRVFVVHGERSVSSTAGSSQFMLSPAIRTLVRGFTGGEAAGIQNRFPAEGEIVERRVAVEEDKKGEAVGRNIDAPQEGVVRTSWHTLRPALEQPRDCIKQLLTTALETEAGVNSCAVPLTSAEQLLQTLRPGDVFIYVGINKIGFVPFKLLKSKNVYTIFYQTEHVYFRLWGPQDEEGRDVADWKQKNPCWWQGDKEVAEVWDWSWVNLWLCATKGSGVPRMRFLPPGWYADAGGATAAGDLLDDTTGTGEPGAQEVSWSTSLRSIFPQMSSISLRTNGILFLGDPAIPERRRCWERWRDAFGGRGDALGGTTLLTARYDIWSDAAYRSAMSTHDLFFNFHNVGCRRHGLFGSEGFRLAKLLSYGKVVFSAPAHPADMAEYADVVDFGDMPSSIGDMPSTASSASASSASSAASSAETESASASATTSFFPEGTSGPDLRSVWQRWRMADPADAAAEMERRRTAFKTRFHPTELFRRAGILVGRER